MKIGKYGEDLQLFTFGTIIRVVRRLKLKAGMKILGGNIVLLTKLGLGFCYFVFIIWV